MGLIKEGLTFESFDQFVKLLPDLCPHFVWRGTSRFEHKLLSRMGRLHGKLKKTHSLEEFRAVERSLIEAFRAKARIHVGGTSYSELELLALAQHYGVPTRLLDWTENPLIALYFAAISILKDQSRDGALWAFHMDKSTPPSAVRPLEVSENVFVLAPYVTQRLASQNALFSISAEPEKEFTPPDNLSIMKCRITKDFKKELTVILPRFGLNRMSIYADLDSYADHVAGSVNRVCNNHKHISLIS